MKWRTIAFNRILWRWRGRSWEDKTNKQTSV